MKSPFSPLLLLAILLLLSGCASKQPQTITSSKLEENLYIPSSNKTTGAAYVAYVPTLSTTKYRVDETTHRVLSPWVTFRVENLTEKWNRRFPAILSQKQIHITGYYPSMQHATAKGASLPGIFTSRIHTDIQESSTPKNQEGDAIQSFVTVKIETEPLLVEPSSGELLWNQKGRVRELIFSYDKRQGAQTLNVQPIIKRLESLYEEAGEELMNALESNSLAAMIVPLEEVRIIKKLPK